MSEQHEQSEQAKQYAEYEKRWGSKSLVELAAALAHFRDAIEEMKEQTSALQKEYDFLRFTLVPRSMDEQGVELLKVEGVGRLGLMSDINCSIKAGAKEQAYVWLNDHGMGDLIQPTVNSSSLKSAIKSAMAGGIEVPGDLFNVAPFTRAGITKTGK